MVDQKSPPSSPEPSPASTAAPKTATVGVPILRTGNLRQNISVKALLYADSGVGKTMLCASAPAPFFLDFEGGLLSVADRNVPYLRITTWREFQEAYQYLASKPKDIQTIIVDSLSEVCNRVLDEILHDCHKEKAEWQEYGLLASRVTSIMRQLKDLPYHLLLTALDRPERDNDGNVLYHQPAMKGRAIPEQVTALVDEGFWMYLKEEKGPDGKMMQVRKLLTQNTGKSWGKDRSQRLDRIEDADMGRIIEKIRGGKS